MGKVLSHFTFKVFSSFFVLFAAFLLAGSTASLHAQTSTVPPPVSENLPPDPLANSPDSAALIDSMDALNDDRKLTPGDRISYRVVEEEKDVPISLTVTDAGELNIPLIGLYPAAGKTCKELAEQLKPKLEKDYFYTATVIIGLDTQSTRSRGKVYLTGQVHTQGSIDLPANESMTVSQAILTIGGLADFADRRRVKLIRKTTDGKTQTIIVDLKEILDRGHSEKDPVLEPGDTINVPEKLINF
jgi:polysaccharide export outer membrane protein